MTDVEMMKAITRLSACLLVLVGSIFWHLAILHGDHDRVSEKRLFQVLSLGFIGSALWLFLS